MKQYNTLGELLIDYRKINKISQLDIAAQFEVDIRTIIRWEKNETLLKPENEEKMLEITFIPYQVIHNLNAIVSIPVFYDFDIRKYSLSSLSIEFQDANWLKIKLGKTTSRLRTIKYESDVDDIIRCTLVQKHILKPINKDLIKKATKLLPSLNFIIFDRSGYYSGHSVFFPLKRSTYDKIKKRTFEEKDITLQDIVDYKKEKNPVFYAYDINTDCNENLYYITASMMKFFSEFNGAYTYAGYVSRHDSYEINKQLGTTLVWEDKVLQNEIHSKAPPRLYEGNFNKFLNQ